MVTKRCSFLSLVLLAVVTILFTGHATAAHVKAHLCEGIDYQRLCRSVVKGITNAISATEAATNTLILETKRAKKLVKSVRKSEELKICNEMLDDALDNLKTSLQNIKDHDGSALNSNLSAAEDDYVTCDDTYAESGKTFPLTKTTEKLRHLASICLALAAKIREERD